MACRWKATASAADLSFSLEGRLGVASALESRNRRSAEAVSTSGSAKPGFEPFRWVWWGSIIF